VALREDDPKLSKLIRGVVDLAENDDADTERFNDAMMNRMTSHFHARQAHDSLQMVGHVARETVDHVKALSDLHRNSAKAHWDKHPQHQNNEKWANYYSDWADLHHDLMRENASNNHHGWTADN
jgi:hypothetical protein